MAVVVRPYYEDGAATLYLGDCMEALTSLPDESVQCIVTSPPYFRQRIYGVPGEIGLEDTPAEYVARIVAVFEEVRRVLRSDGTVFLNLGDSYASSPKGSLNGQGKSTLTSTRTQEESPVSLSKIVGGFKPKDLLGIPWRVAFALQEAGWWLRSDIIWAKPNPMPESVTDRPTRAHEYVFLLAKSMRYYWDAKAVRTPVKNAEDDQRRIAQQRPQNKSAPDTLRAGLRPRSTDKQRGHYRRHAGFNDRWDAMTNKEQMANGAQMRDVLWVPTQPYPGAHYATFPEKLVRTCILAGSRPGDVVMDPFAGSGTLGRVAIRLGRRFVGIEANEEYMALIKERITVQKEMLL